jgi:hypothetical protein
MISWTNHMDSGSCSCCIGTTTSPNTHLKVYSYETVKVVDADLEGDQYEWGEGGQLVLLGTEGKILQLPHGLWRVDDSDAGNGEMHARVYVAEGMVRVSPPAKDEYGSTSARVSSRGWASEVHVYAPLPALRDALANMR